MSDGTTNVPGVCVLIRDGEKILFVQRLHTGFMDGYYVVPSGHVETHETFTQAAVREVYEEVGLLIDPDHLEHKLTAHRKSVNDERVDAYFMAHKWSGEVKNGEPDKHGDPVWLMPEALPAAVAPFIAEAISAIERGLTYLEQNWETPAEGTAPSAPAA
jgi:8-oxo-dGTP diphosphatase